MVTYWIPFVSWLGHKWNFCIFTFTSIVSCWMYVANFAQLYVTPISLVIVSWRKPLWSSNCKISISIKSISMIGYNHFCSLHNTNNIFSVWKTIFMYCILLRLWMWKSFFIDFQNIGRYNALKEIDVYSVSGTNIKLLRFFDFQKIIFAIALMMHICRDQSRCAPSQWETLLHCNDVSH